MTSTQKTFIKDIEYVSLALHLLAEKMQEKENMLNDQSISMFFDAANLISNRTEDLIKEYKGGSHV